jgi:hypothetical protein
MRRTASIWILVTALVAATGCTKEPTAEVEAARQAMEAARSAEAAQYAPDSWRAAEDAEAKLRVELQAQNERFALNRSYRDTLALAAETTAAAEQAAEDARNGKEQTKNDAAKLLEEAKALRKEVDELLAHAPEGKGSVADVAALRADAGATEDHLAGAERAHAAGDYREAKAKAEAAVSALNKVKAEIEAARHAATVPRQA